MIEEKPVIYTNPEFGQEAAETGEVLNRTGRSEGAGGEVDGSLVEARPGIENEEPDKRVIHKMPGRPGKVREFIKAVFGKREETPEEKAARHDREERNRLKKLLEDEAWLARDRIVSALNDLNLCYRYKKSEQDWFISGVQSVQFDRILLDMDAIYLRVGKFPRGVSVNDLANPEIMTHLSVRVGRRVSASYDEKNGLMLMVERGVGVRGIPGLVNFQEMYEYIPSGADELTVLLGKGVGGKRLYRSVKAWPHCLVAGATQKGKSNMINTMICTLAMRNMPERLQFVMIDLKMGAELGLYENIPHMLPVPGVSETGLIIETEGVGPTLAWVKGEIDRRMRLIRKDGKRDILEFNRNRTAQNNSKNLMPHLILIIDELAVIMLVRSLKADAEMYLADICQRGRSAGIHAIIGTQYPKSEVVTGLIRANIDARMAFSCSDQVASRVVIDHGGAAGLEPVGRYIYRHGAEEMTVQAALLPTETVTEIVEHLITRTNPFEVKRPHDVTELEIVEWAYKNLDGRLPYRDLHQQFKERNLSQHDVIKILREMDGKVFLLDGNPFIVKNNPPPGCRKLEKLNEQGNQ